MEQLKNTLNARQLEMARLSTLIENYTVPVSYTHLDVYKRQESLMRLGKSGAGAMVTQVRERAFKNEPGKAQVTDAELMGGSCLLYTSRCV